MASFPVSAPAAGWAGTRPHHDHPHGKHHVSKQDRYFAKAAARSNDFAITAKSLPTCGTTCRWR